MMMISQTQDMRRTTKADFLSQSTYSSTYSKWQAKHNDANAKECSKMRQSMRSLFHEANYRECDMKNCVRNTKLIRIVRCRVPRIISFRNIVSYKLAQLCLCFVTVSSVLFKYMDKLINIARKMEEEEASANKIAKTIVNSYKIMDRQRDELKGIAYPRNYKEIPPVPTKGAGGINTNTNSSFSKESVEKGKPSQRIPSADKKRPSLPQPAQTKQVRPTSTKQLPKQPKPVCLKFGDEDKQFQIFSLKLLFEKVNKLRLLMGRFNLKSSMMTLKKYYQRLTGRENEFILKRARRIMAKYFNLLSKETLILKLERENELAKKELQVEKRQEEKAVDYHEFQLYQKAMRSWKRYTRLAINHKKKLQEEAEQARRPEPAPPVSHLKSKVLDFLQGIKQDIEEQNRPPPVIQQEEFEASQSHTEAHFQAEESAIQEEEEVPQAVNAEHTEIQRANEPQHIPGRKLTHDELLKRREQLQKKNKQRKERLEKIRKEKEQQKARMEQERKLCEQRMKEEQAKRKQEEYQRFLKRKKDQQQAKQREKQELIRIDKLYQFAEQEDKIRLMKHFGFTPWKKLIKDRNNKFEKLAERIQKAHLKLFWLKFLDKYDRFNQILIQKEKLQQDRAIKLFRKKCKLNVLKVLKAYMTEITQQKLQLESRHCVNLCKITFKGWLRAMDTIRLENYQADKIQTQKIQTFRNAYLLKSSFRALARNKQQQKRQRNINEHKNNLKNKLSQWVKQESDINIDKLLQ